MRDNFKEIYQLKYAPKIEANIITNTVTNTEYFSNIENDMINLWEDINRFIRQNDELTRNLKDQEKDKLLLKLRHAQNNYNNAELKIKRLQKELIRPFPVNAEPLRAPYRLNLEEYFIATNETYDVAEQVTALKSHFTKEAEWLSERYIGEYQGDVKAIFSFQDYIFLYYDGFGSCSMCDTLCGLNPEETNTELKRTLSDGNILQFWSLEHAEAYCKAPSNDRYKEWVWDTVTQEMFEEAKLKL